VAYVKPKIIKTESFVKGGTGMYVWHVPTKTLVIGREIHAGLLNVLEDRLAKRIPAGKIIYGTIGSNFMDVRQHPALKVEQLPALCAALKALKLRNVPVFRRGNVELGRLHELATKSRRLK
jgi:hypothetical protein